jgi:hypothetical protein
MSVGGPPSKRPRSSLPSVSNSVAAAAPAAKPPPPDDDDDDIEEVIPVKSEPRDTASSGVVANTDMYGAAAAVGSGGGQSQALAQEEDMVYGQDESYDDYEQYGGEGDGGGGYDDGALLDPSLAGGADGNKGRTTLLLYLNMRLCKGKIRTQLLVKV